MKKHTKRLTIPQQRAAVSRKIRSLLKALGPTENAAYDTLVQRRVTGLTDDPALCPIANYLRDGLGPKGLALRIITYSGAPGEVVVRGPRYQWIDNPLIIDLPTHIDDLVNHFDDGQYPALEGKAMSDDEREDQMEREDQASENLQEGDVTEEETP